MLIRGLKNLVGALTKAPRSLDDELEVRVDANLFRCPVCFNIFGEAPLLLGCGHSFCGQCLDKLPTSPAGVIDCPMCRARCVRRRRFPKNYLMEDVLDSMSAVPDEDLTAERAKDNQLVLVVARLKGQVAQRNEEISALKAANEALNKTVRNCAAVTLSLAAVGLGIFTNFALAR